MEVDELVKSSDIISLHVPSLPETKGMVNKEFLSKMKANGVLINTARGDIINEEDLVAHLDSHDNFYYGCDVF
jgi:lactate dehydrogenase-like 2-hydroxyacid dehydrogenase